MTVQEAQEGGIWEYQVFAADENIGEIINRLALSGWDNYAVIPGQFGAGSHRPIGVTLFFKRPRGYGGRGAKVQPPPKQRR